MKMQQAFSSNANESHSDFNSVFFESALSVSHGKHPPLRYLWKAGPIVSVTNGHLLHRWFTFMTGYNLLPCTPAFLPRKKEGLSG